jgi:hypothetical protein
LNLFQPGECRDLAAQYNDLSDSLAVIMTAYAGADCQVRVVTVAEPSDPYLPPSPIRTLSFQPIP